LNEVADSQDDTWWWWYSDSSGWEDAAWCEGYTSQSLGLIMIGMAQDGRHGMKVQVILKGTKSKVKTPLRWSMVKVMLVECSR